MNANQTHSLTWYSIKYHRVLICQPLRGIKLLTYQKIDFPLSILRAERYRPQLLPWVALDLQHFIYPVQDDGEGAGLAHMLRTFHKSESCQLGFSLRVYMEEHTWPLSDLHARVRRTCRQLGKSHRPYPAIHEYHKVKILRW